MSAEPMIPETVSSATTVQDKTSESLIDVTIQYRWDIGSLVVIGILGGALGAMSGFLVMVPKVFLVIAMIVVGISGFWLMLGLKTWFVQRALSRLSPDAREWPDAIATILTRSGNVITDKHRMRPNYNVLSEVVRALFALGERGRIWRFNAPKDNPSSPPPFTIPFEPVLLREKSDAFQEFTGQRVRSVDVWRHALDAFISTYGQSRIARGLGFLLLLFILIGIVMSVGQSVIDLLNGKPTSLVDLAIFIFVFIALGLLVHAMRPEEWYLVPGAVVVRTSTWSRSNWDVHVLPRRESLLCYWGRVRQLVIIGPEGKLFSRGATLLEAEQAMRAFLAPLPPPSVEDLSDLT